MTTTAYKNPSGKTNNVYLFRLPDDIFDFAHDRVEDVVSNFCRLSEMAKPTEIEDITNR